MFEFVFESASDGRGQKLRESDGRVRALRF